jgi:hypothetical protein
MTRKSLIAHIVLPALTGILASGFLRPDGAEATSCEANVCDTSAKNCTTTDIQTNCKEILEEPGCDSDICKAN